MPWNLRSTHAHAGDIVQLVGLRHKHFIFPLSAGGTFHTHRGIVKHDDMIGLPWGSQVFSHLGSPFFILQPALGDVLIDLPRNTQILYPKDIGFVLVTMGIGEGQRVMEAGTGSGSMTIALAYAVGSEETDVDAFFLDVINPHDYMEQVRAALKPGGFFCSLVPTANQVSMLLYALRRCKFAFIEVCEVLLRYYKPEPSRLRPTDRMVAHTGFLIFARRIEMADDPRARDLLAEAGVVDEEGDAEKPDLEQNPIE
jgi:tRNA (adenine57-N1/adenine58-N1)-methyltransferase